MSILTIIVSYNFERWMDRCLGSLRQSGLQTDVVVVDNNSQDRTVSLVKKRYPEVRLIEAGTNLGFGRANNIGMTIALDEGYDAVFLLNQDAWIAPDTLDALAQLSRLHPEYGILSPTHLTGNGDKLEKGFAAYTGQAETASPVQLTFSAAGKLTTTVPAPAQHVVEPVSFVNAAFWYIPADILRRVGGFCPLFYHYGEDVDYINRLHYHGYQVGYSPTAFGCHDREHRPLTRGAFLRSEQVYLLSEYANVRRSFVKAFAYGVLASIKKAVVAGAKGGVKNAFAYLEITAFLLGKTRETIACRKKNKQQGAWYLLHPSAKSQRT